MTGWIFEPEKFIFQIAVYSHVPLSKILDCAVSAALRAVCLRQIC